MRPMPVFWWMDTRLLTARARSISSREAPSCRARVMTGTEAVSLFTLFKRLFP